MRYYLSLMPYYKCDTFTPTDYRTIFGVPYSGGNKRGVQECPGHANCRRNEGCEWNQIIHHWNPDYR